MVNISHELRTPLTLIYAPLKRLLKSGKVTDKDVSRRSCSFMAQASFRSLRRITDQIIPPIAANAITPIAIRNQAHLHNQP